VKTASEIKKLGHEFCGPVKTSHSLFPKTELEEKLKRWPGGTYLVMKATTVEGFELLAIGYKYNSTKVLTFIATTESGSTVPGTPYRARFVDDFDNLLSRPVHRPQVISTYFSRSNAVDKHNQARQSELKLEKHWKTQNVWFRLVCTIIGINTTDAWKAYKYANNSVKEKAITIREFADRLAFELIDNKIGSNDSGAMMCDMYSPLNKKDAKEDNEEDYEAHNKVRVARKRNILECSPPSTGTRSRQRSVLSADEIQVSVSPLTSTDGDHAKKVEVELLWVKMMKEHKHMKSDQTEKTGRFRRCRCTQCHRKTRWYCGLCNVYCCPETTTNDETRYCYKQHIIKIHSSIGLKYTHT
jgi:hypothetical protein